MTSTGKPTTDPDKISPADWAEGTARNPDDFPAEEGEEDRQRPGSKSPEGGKDKG